MSNLENKVDNIIKAIQDFSENQFATKTDLNRAFNELMKSLGSIADASNEKFSLQFLEHIRYLVDERNKYLQDNLQSFETSMKELADNVDSKNFSYEVKKFSKDLGAVRDKIEEQESLFINLSRSVEELSSDKMDTKADYATIIDNFNALSKSFESVTSILNKNFSNFVSEVKKINNDQAFLDINARLDGIFKAANTIMSTMDVMDSKYQDIKGLVEFITDNESSLSRAISEFSKTTDELNEVMPNLKVVMTKGDLIVLEDKINSINSFVDAFKDYMESTNEQSREETLENLVFVKNKLLEMQGGNINGFSDVIKNINSKVEDLISSSNEELKKSITGQIVYGYEHVQDKFDEGYNNLQENIKNVTAILNNIDDTLSQKMGYEANQIKENLNTFNQNLFENLEKVQKTLNENFSSKLAPIKEILSSKEAQELENITQAVSSSILDLKDILNKNLVENQSHNETIESVEKDIKTVLIGIIDLKNELVDKKEDSSSLIKENLKEVSKGINKALNQNDKLSEISNAINDFSERLDNAFQKLKTEEDAKELNAEVEVIEKLNVIMPSITSSLEEIKKQTEEEYQKSYISFKNDLERGILELKQNIENVVTSIEKSQAKISQGRMQEIRIAMQDVSNILSETIASSNSSIIAALNKNKDEIGILFEQVKATNSDVNAQINDIKSIVEENAFESKKHLTDVISNSTSKYIEFLNTIAGDILSKIISSEETTTDGLVALEEKIKNMAQTVFNSQFTTLTDEITNFTSKIDKVNLQQIASAKELLNNFSALAEIQNNAGESLRTIIADIEEKIKQDDNNRIDKEKIDELKETILQNLKDELVKQTQSFNSGFARIADLNKSKETSIEVINEQIGLLSKTLTQEFRSEFQKQYQAVINGFARITSKQEDSSSGSNSEISSEQIDLIIQNIDQNFKSELQKNEQLLIEDLSRILNSPKNRDANFSALNERINLFSKTITQDFKTELQAQQEAFVSDISKISNSQKSSEETLADLTNKIESFSKAVIQEVSSELQNQQRIIVEDLAKMASVGKDNEETIFDIREKLRTFEENIVKNVKNGIEQEQKVFLDELKDFRNIVLSEDFNKQEREEIEKSIENVGQAILQEVRSELQNQQRLLLNDLARFDSSEEANKNTLNLLLTKTEEISKDIENKISERIQDLQGLIATSIATSSNLRDLQQASDLKFENIAQNMSQEFDEKIKAAKEELLSEIQSIYIPESIDEDALRKDINSNVDNALYVLQNEIDRVKEKIEDEVSSIEIPSYDDSEVKDLLNNLSDKITNSKFDDTSLKDELARISDKISEIQIPEGYDDSSLKNRIDEIQEDIKNIFIPTYDDTEIKNLLNELSDKVLFTRYDDTELKDNILYLLSKVSSIEIPEKYDDEELKKKVEEIEEYIKNIRIPSYDDGPIKALLNELSDKVSNIRYDDSEVRDELLRISNKIAYIRIPEKYDDEILRSRIDEIQEDIKNIFVPTYDDTEIKKLLNEISEKVLFTRYDDTELKDGMRYLSNKILDIKIPEKYNDEELKNKIEELKEDIKNIHIPSYDDTEVRILINEALDKIADAKYDDSEIKDEIKLVSDKISDIKIPEKYNDEELKNKIEELKEDIKNIFIPLYDDTEIKNLLNEVSDKVLLSKYDDTDLKDGMRYLSNKILDIKIPEKYNDEELKEKIEELKEDIKNIFIPLYDDTEVKTLINQAIDKISNIKEPDFNKDDMAHEISISSDAIRANLKDELTKQITNVISKIDEIYIPEISEDKIIDNVSSSVLDAGDNIKSEVRELNYDLKEDIKEFAASIKNEFERIQDTIINEVSTLESNLSNEEIKKYVLSSIGQVITNVESLRDSIENKINSLKIPEQIDENELRIALIGAVNSVSEKINDELQNLKASILTIKIPDAYDDSALKDKIDDVKSTIEKIYIPSYDDSEIRILLNEALDKISKTEYADNELKDKISQIKEDIKNIIIPYYDDSALKVKMDQIRDDVQNIVIPHYDDSDLKDKISQIKEDIKNIIIPYYDDSEIRKLLEDLSDKVLSSKYDDNDLKNGLRYLSDKISDIKIPEEINVKDLQNSVKSDVEEIISRLADEIEKAHNELRDKILSIKIPEQQDLKQFKEDICDDTKNFIDNLKDELENVTRAISTQITQIKIPDSEILKEDINSNTNNALSEIQNKIDELHNKIKAKIEDIEYPDTYDDTNLKQIVYNTVENLAENIKKEFENCIEKTRNLISSIEMPERYNDSEVQSKLDNISNKIENIDIPKYDDSSLREELYVIKNHIDTAKDDVVSKLDRVDNIPNEEFISKQFGYMNNEIELKFDNLEEKIKEKINSIELPKNIDKDELISAISGNVRGIVYEVAGKVQEIKTLFENSSKNIESKLDTLNPLKADDLEESTDLIIGVIREKLKESAYIQNKFVNGQLAQLLETISKNDSEYLLQKTLEKLYRIQNDDDYGLKQLEEDIKNVKIAVDQTNSVDLVKNLSAVQTLTGENIKLNQHVEQQLSYTNNWLRNAAKAMEILTQKVFDMEKAQKEEKVFQIDVEKFENVAVNLAQKYKLQEKRLHDIEGKINNIAIKQENMKELDNKINSIIDKQEDIKNKQNEMVDANLFTKIFEESANQTNDLSERMTAIENKMKTIEKSLDRIIAFIES